MRTLHCGLFLLVVAGTAAAQSSSSPAALIAEGRKTFELRCGACHGGDGRGGERAPDIVTTRSARRRNAEQVRKLIREGIPDAGMPGFDLPENELAALVTFYRSLTSPASQTTPPGDAEAGERLFFGKANCHTCHVRGDGGIVGPDLSAVGARLTLAELQSALQDPGADIADGYDEMEVKLKDGELVRGFARNESDFDLQLQTIDGRFRSIRSDQIAEKSRKPGSLMPRFSGGDVELENLVAFLSRLDGTASSPLRQREASDAALPGAVSFDNIAAPQRGRLADLQRPAARQPPQRARRNQDLERGEAARGMDVPDPFAAFARGHADRGERHHVRDRGQRGLRARCAHRARDLALRPAADQRRDRRRRLGHQPRRGDPRRPRLPGHRQRPPAGARPAHAGGCCGRPRWPIRTTTTAARWRR